jgi:hypothetical protein
LIHASSEQCIHIEEATLEQFIQIDGGLLLTRILRSLAAGDVIIGCTAVRPLSGATLASPLENICRSEKEFDFFIAQPSALCYL